MNQQNSLLTTMSLAILFLSLGTEAMGTSDRAKLKVRPDFCPNLTLTSPFFESPEFKEAHDNPTKSVKITLDGTKFNFRVHINPLQPHMNHTPRVEWHDKLIPHRCYYERTTQTNWEWIIMDKEGGAEDTKKEKELFNAVKPVLIETLKKLRNDFPNMRSFDFLNIASLILIGNKTIAAEIKADPTDRARLERELTALKEKVNAVKIGFFPELKLISERADLIPEELTKLRTLFPQISDKDFVLIIHNLMQDQQNSHDFEGDLFDDGRIVAAEYKKYKIDSTDPHTQQMLRNAVKDVRKKFQWSSQHLFSEAAKLFGTKIEWNTLETIPSK